jgi:acyl-CoA reductase-like NAD-dependent aldehyde dehydrogenase
MATPTVLKTIKLFIGGEFPRTESGRTMPILKAGSKQIYANACRASRKDFRNAVTAAREAQSGWAHRSAYNRSQILYRMAEMFEGKRHEFVETLCATNRLSQKAADQSVNEAIEALVYYAGFCDKFQQLMGAVNPVSGPHHNFTTAEGVGVVTLIGDEEFSLGEFVAQIAAIVATGSTLVALMQMDGAALLAPLAEVFATSDLPKGAINLLTGDTTELSSAIGGHMEVQSISYQGRNKKLQQELSTLAADNLKRVIGRAEAPLSLEHLLSYVEYKTAWHPVGL